METNTINSSLDAILKKKTEGYDSSEMKNFSAPGEITVTITLEEYRKLVENNATRKYAIDQANNDRYQRNEEIKAKATEIESLKAENYELKKLAEEAKKNADAWQKEYIEIKETCDGLEEAYEDQIKKLREEAGTWEHEYDKTAREADALRVEVETLKARIQELQKSKDKGPESGPSVAGQIEFTLNKKTGKEKVNLDIDKIKALKKAGWNVAKIAEEMGVSQQTIYSRLKEEKDDN